MMSTRRPSSLTFTAPLVLDPPRHSGLSSIALVPGRHLIGAGEECGIRLPLDGIVDRHALILVGENRTIVKSMDSHTWVNDSPVSDMALRPGDRLSIGPLTFRVRSATKEEEAVFEVHFSAPPIVRPHPEQDTLEPPSVPLMAVSSAASSVASTRVHELPTKVDPPVQSPAPVSQRVTPPAAVTSNVAARPSPAVEIHVEEAKSAATSPDRAASRASRQSIPPANDRVQLDSRLDEIQQRLADLRKSTSSVPGSKSGTDELDSTRDSANFEAAELWKARQEELQQKSDLLAAESLRLQLRETAVAEREVRVEQRQQLLQAEVARITELAESTRRNLAEEHSQHVAVWTEWETTFQRMTGELASQVEAVEKQRESIKAETERLGVVRADLQRVRSDLEQERQNNVALRAKLTGELAELESLKSQLDSRDQQLLAREQRLETSRREFGQQQSELSASMQNLDSQRQSLHEEWSAHLQRIEQETRRLTELQQQVDADRKSLLSLRSELETDRNSLAAERHRLTLDRLMGAAPVPSMAPLAIEHFEVVPIPDQTASIESEVPEAAVPENTLPVPSAPSVDSANVELSIETPSDSCQRENDEDLEAVSQRPPQADVGVTVDWSTLPEIDSPPSYETVTATGDPAFDLASLYGGIPVDRVVPPGSSASEFPENSIGTTPWPQQFSAAESAVTPRDEFPWNSDPGFSTAKIPEFPTSFASPGAISGAAASLASNEDPWAAIGPAIEPPADSPMPSVLNDVSGAVLDRVASEIDSRLAPSASPKAEDKLLQVGEMPFSGDSAFASETLAAVNEEFGIPVESGPSEQPAGSLPSWWMENPTSAKTESADPAKPGWVIDALRADAGEPDATDPQPQPAAEPENDLRSRLAMLFDLPATASDEAPEEPKAADGDVDRPEISNDVSTFSLREAMPMLDEAAEEIAEDSVDAFMQRLLARSRTGDSERSHSNSGRTPQPAADALKSEALPSTSMTPTQTAVSDQDRSHLMAEPKHKQDKQAVRENLQSFRQVAHLSARSALARHSLQQLRNATIAKGVLMGISTVAAVWFFGEPLLGKSLQVWKGSACLLAVLLSAIEFNRSWRQLNQTIKLPGAPATGTGNVAVESKSEVVEEASSVSEQTVAEVAEPAASTEETPKECS